MTLPVERTKAVVATRKFLQNLCDTKVTPGLQRSVREQARALLRHYPNDSDLNLIANGWGEPTVRFTFQCPFGRTDEQF